MSLNHSPSIVTNGLIMYYDAANTQKSWKGAPTTNILESNLSAFNDIYGNSSKTIISSNEVQWINTGIGPTTVRMYVPQASLTNAQTYGLSVYVKDLVGTVSFDWCDQTITGVNSLTNTTGRLTGTASRSSYDSTYRFLDVNLSIGGRMTLYNPQVDSVNYVTSYVDPTTSRNTSQAIIDLTGNNTLTATSLTYASDNTFSFNGTTDRILATNTAFNRTTGQEISASCWIKPYRLGGQYNTIINCRTDSAYNWMLYMHAADGALSFHGAAQNKTTVIPTVNTWVHVTNTVTSAGVSTLYVNGVSSAVVNGYTYNLTSPGQVGIGAWGTYTGESFQGLISNVQIHNRALSAGEVAQNFNALRGRYGV